MVNGAKHVIRGEVWFGWSAGCCLFAAAAAAAAVVVSGGKDRATDQIVFPRQ